MRVLLLLVMCLPCFGQINDRIELLERPNNILIEYDKFQLETTAQAKDRKVRASKGSDISVTAIVVIPDNGKPMFTLHFKPSLRSTVYDNPTLRALINDRALIEWPSRQYGSTAIFTIRPDQFERLAEADTVEFQLGTFEGKLDDSTITAFKNLLALTKLPPLK